MIGYRAGQAESSHEAIARLYGVTPSETRAITPLLQARLQLTSAQPCGRLTHAGQQDEPRGVLAKLAPLDEAALQKALWNLYWRGSAQVRERIEGELEPAEKGRRQRAAGPVRVRRVRRPRRAATGPLGVPVGWTRSGWGQLSEKETSLASVLARGDQDRARDLVRTVLEELPGHQEALAFAAETGAVPGTDPRLDLCISRNRHRVICKLCRGL